MRYSAKKICNYTLASVAAAAFVLHGFLGGDESSARSKALSKQTTVGEPLVLHLKGKPKMGYAWRVNAKKSRGLDLVKLDRMGWTFADERRGSGSFTKPGTLRYAVHPKQAGSAMIVFEYFRKEANASPSASRQYTIEIRPKR